MFKYVLALMGLSVSLKNIFNDLSVKISQLISSSFKRKKMRILLIALISIISMPAKADPMADIYIDACAKKTEGCIQMTAAAREVERFNKLMSQKSDEKICGYNAGLKDFSDSIVQQINLSRDDGQIDKVTPTFAFANAVAIAGQKHITCE